VCGGGSALEHLTTHTFRHSYRTWLSHIGKSLDATMRLMRHSTIAMTMDTYDALPGNEASEATAKIALLAFHSLQGSNLGVDVVSTKRECGGYQ